MFTCAFFGQGFFCSFKKVKWRSLAVLFPALFCQLGLAQSDIEHLVELNLDELLAYQVYSPTKSPLKLSDSPGTVSVITYDQIQRSSATTIPELLRLVPGVSVRWNPMVQTIDIRSFGSNPFTSKVLLLIDGVPYNSWNKGGFPQHPGFDFFNLANVKHLEVIRGAGSALFGENAFNGVINIVTLSGEEFQQTRASVRLGDRQTKAFNLLHGSKTSKDSDLFVSARIQESQLPQEVWMDDTEENAKGYDLYFKYRVQNFQLTYYRLEDRYGGFNHSVDSPLVPPGTTFSSADKIRQEVNIGALKYANKAADDSWSVEANLSYSDRYGSHCAACHAPGQSDDFSEQEDHGNQKFANFHFSRKLGEHNEILMGAEYRRIAAGDHDHEFAGSDSFGPIEEVRDHADMVVEYDKQAFFIQDRLTLLDDRLQITAGGRYDSRTDPDLFGDEFFPRVSVVGKLSDQLTIKGSWNKAARYPSFTELYQNSWFLVADTPFGNIPLANFTPNHSLKPEHIEGFELGLEYRPRKDLFVKADYFHNDIEDSIALSYPAIQFLNHPADATISGVEIEVRYQPYDSLSAFANWAYQDNDAEENVLDIYGSPLEMTYSPEHKVNAGVTYSPIDELSMTLETSWRDQYMAPAFWYTVADDVGPEPAPLPGYYLLDFNIKYKPRAAGPRLPLTISLIAKNIGNERPYETLSGFGGRRPGREFYLTFQYDWML